MTFMLGVLWLAIGVAVVFSRPQPEGLSFARASLGPSLGVMAVVIVCLCWPGIIIRRIRDGRN